MLKCISRIHENHLGLFIIKSYLSLKLFSTKKRKGKHKKTDYITNAVFSSVYICEKLASLAYQEKNQLQKKSIIA